MANKKLKYSETNNDIYQFQSGYILVLKNNSHKTSRDQVNNIIYLSFNINTKKYIKIIMKKTIHILALIML